MRVTGGRKGGKVVGKMVFGLSALQRFPVVVDNSEIFFGRYSTESIADSRFEAWTVALFEPQLLSEPAR